SPSPISARANPNLRASETNSSVRRSFSGNPFARTSILTNPKNFDPTTPANSPADLGRRILVGKEEKENAKDYNLMKAAKIRSPAKGSKNFMSPTISAASKFTPSPKKKVFTERKEPARKSVSFADAADLLHFTENSEPNLEMDFDQRKTRGLNESNLAGFDQKEVVLEVPPISNPSKEDSCPQVPLDFHSTPEIEESSNFKIKHSCSSVSPVIAPLDADPTLPPYDPKTNYLSPRPQFLRYEPNLRIELFLHKEKGLDFGESKQHEDGMTFENLSETDLTEETQSGDSQKDSEDASSTEAIAEEEGEKEEEMPVVSKPLLFTNHMPEQYEGKRATNLRFLRRLKSVPLVLVFLIACVSVFVIYSPLMGSSMMKDLRVSKHFDPSEVAIFAKANYYVVATKFKQWSANTVSSLFKLIPHLGEADKLILLEFGNLTASREDLLVGGYLKATHVHKKSEQSHHELDELEPVKEREAEGYSKVTNVNGILEENHNELYELERVKGEEIEIDPPEDKAYSEVDSDDHIEEVSAEEIELGLGMQAEMNDFVNSTEVQSTVVDLLNNINVIDQSDLTSEGHNSLEIKPEVRSLEIPLVMVGTDDVQGDNDLSSSANTQVHDVEASPEMADSETLDSPLYESGAKLSPRIVLGTSLFFLALVAAGTVMYLKQGSYSTVNVPVHVDPLMTKKLISSPASNTIEHAYQNRLSSQNWQTEVDVVGDSCPSEMSSFQKSYSYSTRGQKGTDEAQSHERKPRKYPKRESLASSSEYSTGSPSYGSFTTFERIPIKHASGDDEIVTPVRRSSRIRSHVTSP
ncbi:hypothetical protein RJ639_011256, partial [Escallonia herrerae]